MGSAVPEVDTQAIKQFDDLGMMLVVLYRDEQCVDVDLMP